MFRLILSACKVLIASSVFVFAQSIEQGQIFNKYATAAEDGVNLFSGTSALKRTLATISSGRVSAAVELRYFGNVGETVMNKNDIAPTSWVGLGWSLGHAKIVCENAGTMWLGDDSYYLISQSGVKYKILKSGKNADNSDKWWIESLPYWSVKPYIEEFQFGQNRYEIIVGWEIRGDAGNKYFYGDDYGDGNYQKYLEKRNATEYTLANPYSLGVVGVIDNGNDELFPSAWNLRKIEDLDGNYLEYEYHQFLEKVRKRKYHVEVVETRNGYEELKKMLYGPDILTNNAYTKECYLKMIKSSQGESIFFETKQKDYRNEFLDEKGNFEKDASNPDAYIDPVERRYLSKIVVQKEFVNKKGEKEKIIVKNIDFCYRPLNVEFNKEKKMAGKSGSDDNSEYVKRLLVAVVESSEKGEIQREQYSYYERDFDPVTKLPLNIGALQSIKSNNCGTVEYVYENQELSSSKGGNAQYDVVPLVNIIMGYLDDGTAYIAGLNKKESKVQVYHRINGTWKLIQNLNEENDSYKGTKIATYDPDGEFIAGDENWFIYKEKKSETYRPFVWNGAFWETQKEIVDGSSHNFVEVGPGYILKAHVDNESIVLTMPWNIWNGGSDEKILDRNADDDEDDRKYTALFTSRNHFGVFFKDKRLGNSGHLKIYSFQPDKSIKPMETLDKGYLDDDNHYAFVDDNILIGGIESSGLWGQNAVAYHFYEKDDKEPDWYEYYISGLDGWQGYVDIMGLGDGYFVLRHNDNDDLSLFEFDGEKWSAKIDGKNMVHQDYDPKTEAEWVSFNGYNFFAVLYPYVERNWYYNYIRPERNYGYYYKEKKDWKWKSLYEASSKDEDRKKLYAGRNWFIAGDHRKAWINNGKEWKDEEWNSWFPFYEEKVSSLNGDFLVAKSGDNSYVFYKKRDSFVSGVDGFFVTKKIVEDPIMDKKIEYTYDYRTLGDDYPAYDYVTKSPAVKGVTILLPEKSGYVEKKFCDGTGEMLGVAKGQVCKETYYLEGIPLNKIEKKFTRYRGKNNSWPGCVYIDRLIEVTSEIRNLKTLESYNYADGLNDLIKSSTVKNLNTGKNESESVTIFAAEVEDYKDEFKKDNRLVEKAAAYQCVPDCKSGKVVFGRANKYAVDDKDNESGKLRVSEEWTYLPKNGKDSKFLFDWKKSKFDSWKQTKTYSHFYRGEPTQTEDMLGIKASVLYDKGSSKRTLASVNNAGVEEVLLMPGDTCGIANWNENKCKIITLNGRFFEKSDPNASEIDYGRFSNNAVCLWGNDDLTGYVLHAKKSKYLFSSWVQGTDYSNEPKSLNLKINGKNVKSFPLNGKGKWEYVEWISDSEYGKDASIAVSLSSSDGSEIRLQDIRFVPVDAAVNVLFYDKIWNKPIASVNDRSVGKYFVYDYQGRVVQTYGENANRDILLTSKNTFVSGVCSVSEEKYSLKKLIVNGIDVPITGTPGTIDISVDNGTDELNVFWETAVEGERVFYRMYETGKESTSNYIEDDCCSSSKKIVHDFIGSSMVLDIAVSTTDRPYRITLSKATTGWVDYGKNLGEGSVPVFWSENDVSGMFYLDNGDLIRAYFDGSEWKKYSEKQNVAIEYIGSVINNYSTYMFTLPDFVAGDYNESVVDALGANAKGLFSSVTSLQDDREKKLVSLGDFGGAGIKSNHYRIASNFNNTESYVVYEKIVSEKTDQYVTDERYSQSKSITLTSTGKEASLVLKSKKAVNKDTSLVAKKLKNKSWVDCGIVLNSGVEDLSLTVGPRNIPYVAYIGKSASKKQKKVLVDVPESEKEYANENAENIPDAFKFEYEESDLYVVIKHLNLDENSDKWVGYGSDDGDILQLGGKDLLGAKKVKMASDENSLYLAVLYDELNNNSKLALKVFKLEEASGKLKNIEIVDTFVGSSTIAYLEENDHFDIEVNNGIPFITFENEDNDNYVSVLRFEGSRWKSVGRPAFAKISSQKYSLDFAVDNNIPYVVFKESEESLNSKRQGKIVSKKYSSYSDKDLTISSIGDKRTSSLFNMFRQYILNYQYDVSKSTDQIMFNIQLSNVDHVKAVSIKNNGNEIFNWKKNTSIFSIALFNRLKNGSLSSALVPLENGKNKIQIQVWGENEEILTYNFVIRRDYVDGFALKVVDQNGTESPEVYKSVDGALVASPSAILDDSAVITLDNPTYAIFPPDDGSNKKTMCFEHNSSWRMIVNGCVFSKNVCLDYDFVNRSIVVPAEQCSNSNEFFVGSSSSTISSSSSNSSQMFFVDMEGNELIVDIVVLDNRMSSSSESSWNNPEMMSSSSVIETNSCSSVSKEENSSSSSISSSFSSIENNDVFGEIVSGTAIPKDYSHVLDYKIIGVDKISFENFAIVNKGNYIAGSINIAANAQIFGSVTSYGNVFVGNNAYVSTLVVGGSKEIQEGAVITNYSEDHVPVPAIPSVSFTYGAIDVDVKPNESIVLHPGNYGNISVFANASVVFYPGVYHVKSFYVAPDAVVDLKTENSRVQFWVQDDISVGDRSKFLCRGGSSKCFIYGNSSGYMYFGVDSNIEGYIACPAGFVTFSPKSTLSGAIWAKSVVINANATVK